MKIDPASIPGEHFYLDYTATSAPDGKYVTGQLAFYYGDDGIVSRMFMNYSNGNWQEVPSDLSSNISKLQYLKAPKVKEALHRELMQVTHLALIEYLRPPVASEAQKAISHSRQLRSLNAAVHLRRRVKGLGLKGIL